MRSTEMRGKEESKKTDGQTGGQGSSGPNGKDDLDREKGRRDNTGNSKLVKVKPEEENLNLLKRNEVNFLYYFLSSCVDYISLRFIHVDQMVMMERKYNAHRSLLILLK